MSDIVERLRRKYSTGSVNYRDMVLANPDGEEAAATIERLMKERNDVLEEAAKKADRIAEIIKRNLYHQHEKVEDARMFALQLAGDLRSLKGGKS